MNRNTNSHFALAPSSLDVRRSQFDRSSGVKFSADIGMLVPFYVDEVLPGDTFKITTSKVVRLQTLVHPIMDNMYMDTYWFFVPNRLVWSHWKNFMGESEKAWIPQQEYTIPKLILDKGVAVGSLADYMGIPLGEEGSYQPSVNALPFRAYAKICDDWFRSEALTDPLVIPDDDSNMVASEVPRNSDLFCAFGSKVFTACKFHDYFTSALPAPQSGPDVRIPINKDPNGIPVITGERHPLFTGQSLNPLIWQGTNNGTAQVAEYSTTRSTSSPFDINAGSFNPDSGLFPVNGLAPINLWAGVNAADIGTINDLRVAFQVQKFYEKMSYGRRYIEILKSQFGVTSPDARLQRSEYLGGNRIPINVSEVTNNSSSDSAVLGDLGAMSRTSDVHSDFVHSFTEHGYLFGLCVIRYDHSYPQGLDRHYMRNTIWDYYFPVFANLGEQPVYLNEINYLWLDPNGQTPQVFGYNERWAEYRFKPSRVCGELRPEAPQSLASWHLGDYYQQSGDGASGPFLSDDWIREDKTNVDRVLAVTSANANQYIADFWIKNVCTRVMPMYSIPGLADHH